MLVAADQAVYSLGTLILTATVAIDASTMGLATFGAAYAVYWLLAGSARAYFGESQLVRRAKFSVAPNALTWPRLLIVALLAGMAFAAFTPLFGGESAQIWITMAGATLAVVVADYLRLTLIAHDRFRSALGQDVTWLTVQVAATAFAWETGHHSAMLDILAWGGGALLSVPVVMALGRPVADTRRPSTKHDVERGLLAEFVVASGTQQLLPILMLVAGATSTLAAFRAGQTLVAPINVLITATTTLAYGQLARARSSRPTRVGSRVAIVVAVATLAYSAALATATMIISRERSIPANFELALELAPYYLATMAVNGLMTGGIVASRVIRTPSGNFMRRFLTAPVLLLIPLTLVLWHPDSLSLLGVGLFLASSTSAAIWWLGLRRAAEVTSVRLTPQPLVVDSTQTEGVERDG
ncbi:hypothetical protein [Modestobacter sp. SYSU DS0875]